MIHPTAILYDNVILGKNVSIGPYSVIGAPAEVKTNKEQVKGKVIIGDNTIIREFVTIHSPRTDVGETVIGNDCYIQAHSHIGHDAKLDNKVTISCYACVGGHTIIGEHANMGLHSVTHQRTIIENGVMLGANAFAKGKLLAFMVYVGTPAVPIKVNQYMINELMDEVAKKLKI